MKKVILLLLLTSWISFSQDYKLAEDFYFAYENLMEETLSHRLIKHSDIIPLIEQIKINKDFTVTKVGESVEKRDIFLIKWGEGKTKIFLWSQMHGDEPTATMALFDIFKLLSSKDDFKEVIQKLREELTIYFIPMLNPDGAERFQRRNVYDIDINRDALRLATPEAKILMYTFDSLKADFGFNLHDQSSYLTTGQTYKSAAISFLAPAFNFQRTYNEARENAAKVISIMTSILKKYIPGHIGKYSDEFEPRAFGDVFQSKGTSTILIESGGWKNDPERQYVRKMNFLAIVSAFYSIADNTYKEAATDVYEKLPENERYLYDILIRNITISENGHEYISDLPFMINEQPVEGEKRFKFNTFLAEKGDQSTFYGYEEFDFSGLTASAGLIYPAVIKTKDDLRKLDVYELISSGYTTVKINWKPGDDEEVYLLNLADEGKEISMSDLFKPGRKPNFIFKKGDEVVYAFINNYLLDVKNKSTIIATGKK